MSLGAHAGNLMVGLIVFFVGMTFLCLGMWVVWELGEMVLTVIMP